MTNPALLAAAPLAFLAALPAMAESYACDFEAECRGHGSCEGAEPIAVRIVADGEGWRLELPDEGFPLEQVLATDTGIRHYLAAPIDADAGAVALISIYEGGTAYLTLTGDFLQPTAVSHLGRCLPEEN